MSPVDQYIRRATTGLPNRTRLDTAAELRVHLNERIKQYVAQGFDRAEAEHLAVEQMGPAEPVNRSFLGHVFTPRVGWVVLALLVLASGGWLGGNYLFTPEAKVELREVSFQEILPFIGDFQSVQLTLPKGTRSLYWATIADGGAFGQGGGDLTRQFTDLRPNQRISVPLAIGFLNNALGPWECDSPSRWLYVLQESGTRVGGCIPMPSSEGSWTFLMQNDTSLSAGTWHPLFVFKPSILVDDLLPGQRAMARMSEKFLVDGPRETWVALSVYAATAASEAFDPGVPPPTIGDIVLQHRWLDF